LNLKLKRKNKNPECKITPNEKNFP